MLTLVLAEAELERVPAKISGHKQVMAAARAVGRKPTDMLLDASLHHAALGMLPDGRRRGRPDIVHVALLTALESRANKAGVLRLAVHTRNDDWIDVDPATRLIRNYPRFCGLLEKLFQTGAVPADPVLLRLRRGRSLAAGVAELGADRVLWFDETATLADPRRLFDEADGQRHVVAVVGAFPSGTFQSPVIEGAQQISLGPDPLAAWTVVSEVAVRYGDVAPARSVE